MEEWKSERQQFVELERYSFLDLLQKFNMQVAELQSNGNQNTCFPLIVLKHSFSTNIDAALIYQSLVVFVIESCQNRFKKDWTAENRIESALFR